MHEILGIVFWSFTDCVLEELCDCEGHNCVEAQLAIGHTAAAATTTKSVEILLIVFVSPTPTASEIDTYTGYWEMCLIRSNVRIKSA